VISVDPKKKELVGNLKNNGREWHRKGTPEAVNVHDFIDRKLGRAVPFGVYDITSNVGWVSVGTDREAGGTTTFTVTWVPLNPTPEERATFDGGHDSMTQG
jgi:hypothetical protein